MDFDNAIAAHAAWKRRLQAYLKKPDRSLSAADVARDSVCDLGKWIYAETTKHPGMQEFQTLRSEHARFHKAAADIVNRADTGKNVSEEMNLGSGSEFMSASCAVVNAITAIRSKLEAKVPVSK